MSFASTSTEFAMIDTRTTSGAFVLPLTTDIPGRIINIKDAYGAFTNSTLTVYTQGGEAFEDGTNFKLLNNAFDSFQVYTASTSRWYITGGTETNMTTANIAIVSTLQTFNWPSFCNRFGAGYASTFNPAALGKISFLDNVFTSSTAGLVSTFIELGNLNAQPAIMSTGGAFRWLMGVEPDAVSMGRGLQFKIKRWTSFGMSNSALNYGANLSTLLDTVNINSLGFVGINCNNPSFTLDVAGNARILSTGGAGGSLTLQGQVGGIFGVLSVPSQSPSSLTFNWGDGTGWNAYFRGHSNRTIPIMTMIDREGFVGINTSAPGTTLDVVGQIRASTISTNVSFVSSLAIGLSTGVGVVPLDVWGLARSRIITSTLTTNPFFAVHSYAQYYNLSNTGITGAQLPALGPRDNGWYVVLRNNTAITLTMNFTGSLVGLPSSGSNTIAASNSLTVAWDGSSYLYY